MNCAQFPDPVAVAVVCEGLGSVVCIAPPIALIPLNPRVI